ncbi:uncharacterized protein LOC8263380 [Ricinus communis]|uniref:RRM domain-containing protein n=1 Tax=Ricinus communis TaxID=3988 RepID=B9SD45_RICCO|nr:uncharacterized protein LOC8263380 [Ricinus communis]EEF38483.1 hypothetical protein RCOM_1069440 [Ricinus communis]|eukprot:XP_002523914.1 uncharacterized protein LOC8263380 [Ricinus communis]
MASLYSAFSSSNPLSAPTVSQEHFNAFHNIDRLLYTRLLFSLDRDPAQSMQVMALFLWLERSGHVNDFVSKMLLLPDTLINSIADEAVICLNCIESDQFHFYPDNSSTHDNIPLIHCVSKTGISLQFFHENRLTILRAVSKIVAEVCLRAFEDIVKQAEKFKSAAIVAHEGRNRQETTKPVYFYGPMINPAVLPVLYDYQPGSSQFMSGGHQFGGSQFMSGGHQFGSSQFMSGGGYSGNLLHGSDPYDLSVQRQVLNNQTGDMFSHLQICPTEEEKDNINMAVDDRTIFLTFSKGYPISESEVKEFFTRKYGDCIETIYMQEVLVGDHQPLYARLIVRSPTLIEVVLEGKSKAKFSINGKHVWARKYIRKNPRFLSPLSPPQSASPSQPTSPAGGSIVIN